MAWHNEADVFICHSGFFENLILCPVLCRENNNLFNVAALPHRGFNKFASSFTKSSG